MASAHIGDAPVSNELSGPVFYMLLDGPSLNDTFSFVPQACCQTTVYSEWLKAACQSTPYLSRLVPF